VKDLTPEEIELIEAWRNEDASRLLLSVEEALKEMELEKASPKPTRETGEILQKIFDDIKSGEMTVAQFEKLLKSPQQIAKILGSGKNKYTHTDPFVIQKLAEWRKFYKFYFGLDLDVSEIRVPEKVVGFDQLVVVSDWMSFTDIVAISKIFSNIEINDFFMKGARSVSDRADESYAVWARQSSVPDADLMGQSADDVRSMGIDVMTIEEWILLEMFLVFAYGRPAAVSLFSDLNRLMDIGDTWTLAAGTVLNKTASPAIRCNLNSNTINISYAALTFASNPNLGARRVIT